MKATSRRKEIRSEAGKKHLIFFSEEREKRGLTYSASSKYEKNANSRAEFMFLKRHAFNHHVEYDTL